MTNVSSSSWGRNYLPLFSSRRKKLPTVLPWLRIGAARSGNGEFAGIWGLEIGKFQRMHVPVKRLMPERVFDPAKIVE